MEKEKTIFYLSLFFRDIIRYMSIEDSLKKENHEKIIETGVYDLDSFKKEILKDNPFMIEVKDSRFLPIDKGGVFKYFHYIEDFENNSYVTGEALKKFFPFIKINNEIVALSKLSERSTEYFKENTYAISFVSVDKKFQGKGYASKLLEEIFLFAKKHKIHLQNSSYSNEGEEKLYEVVQRLRKKYPEVDFQEDEVYMNRRRRMERKNYKNS